MKKLITCLITLLFFAFIPGGMAQRNTLTFAAQWLPQAQFAGFYVAQDRGFYEEAGLEVSIIHPTVNMNASQFLADGTADIVSLFLITGLDYRLGGLELVNIAQFSQHSAILFVTKKSSGIDELSELRGKEIGIWKSGFQEVPRALMAEKQLDVRWVPIQSTVNLFMLDGIDAMTVMWYNEYDQIYLSGVKRDEMNTFFMSDYGFNIPEDGLYVLRHTRETKQRELEAFVTATMKGWEYAAQNRDYALDLVIQQMRGANVPCNKAHQAWMLDKVLEMQQIKNKQVKPTELGKEDFEKTLNIVVEDKKNINKLEYNDFFQPVLPVWE